MIKIKIKDKNSQEASFLTFKKATSFALKKYRTNPYFHKKNNSFKAFIILL